MKLRDLYPYWEDAHGEFLETLARVSLTQWDARPAAGGVSIQQIGVDVLHQERFWAAHLIAGYEWASPRLRDYTTPAMLSDALRAQREVTEHIVEPLTPAGLRAVRAVPADPQTNRPETNVPIAGLLWHVLEQELRAWGQVTLRLSDARAAAEEHP